MAEPIPFFTDKWYSIHDTVMGGRSSGMASPRSENNSILFSGVLSLENNGGFASIRLPVAESQLRGAKGIRISVVGDGRTYLATIRRAHEQRMIYHRVSFSTTKRKSEEIFLPFSDYRAFAYGRPLPQVLPLHHQHLSLIHI